MTRFTRTPVTLGFLVLIAALFAFELARGALGDSQELISMGAIHGRLFQRHDYWNLIAAMFLHGNLLHWLANSWALLQLGGLFEEMFGSKRLIAVWFATGICASLASAISLDESGVAVGASGAIFGVMGAFLFGLHRSSWRNHPIVPGLRAQLAFWAVVNLVFGLMTPFIDNAAHIGGLVSGIVLGLIPHQSRARPGRRG